MTTTNTETGSQLFAAVLAGEAPVAVLADWLSEYLSECERIGEPGGELRSGSQRLHVFWSFSSRHRVSRKWAIFSEPVFSLGSYCDPTAEALAAVLEREFGSDRVS